MGETIIPRKKYPCSLWVTQALIQTVFKIFKEDKEDINHEDERANYLNEYRPHEQTLNLVQETKKEVFPVQTKTKSQNSTAYANDGFLSSLTGASFRYRSSICLKCS